VVWGQADFTVDLLLVGMEQQGIEQAVGRFQIDNAIRRQLGRQMLLPIIVMPFDFAFGLRRWRVAQSQPVELQSRSQLRQCFCKRGKEKAVVIDIEGARDAYNPAEGS
jgi:hypothetical protein